MKVAVLVSAIAEWNGVKPLFPNAKIQRFPFGECFDILLQDEQISFFHSGWGKIASAGSMQYVIDNQSPDLIVNLGTCGGFEGQVTQGELVLVDETYVYDIVELMGDMDIVSYYACSLDLSWLAEPYPYPARRGKIASADSDLPPAKIPVLQSQGVIAADWESASGFGRPCRAGCLSAPGWFACSPWRYCTVVGVVVKVAGLVSGRAGDGCRGVGVRPFVRWLSGWCGGHRKIFAILGKRLARPVLAIHAGRQRERGFRCRLPGVPG